MESDLVTQLKTLCPRVFPDAAPSGTAVPLVRRLDSADVRRSESDPNIAMMCPD